MALGYYHNDAQTQQAFLSTVIKDQRVYRTGDLGRWNDTGQLELIGRNDRQINLRGHRIDCRGIDQVLETHPSVLRAFTILVGENEQKRLASAIQCVNSELPEDVVLIRHCRTQLPDAHVPSQFLFLNDFPLNALSLIHI